jgi:hypothetical protein
MEICRKIAFSHADVISHASVVWSDLGMGFGE